MRPLFGSIPEVEKGCIIKRILLVDDEPQIVELLKSRLEQCGYEVETAYSGAEVYERLRTASYDLIVLDFFLPDLIADDICKNIRKESQYAELPIIIITGFAGRDAETFLDQGATDVLFKPIKSLELVDAIQKLI